MSRRIGFTASTGRTPGFVTSLIFSSAQIADASGAIGKFSGHIIRRIERPKRFQSKGGCLPPRLWRSPEDFLEDEKQGHDFIGISRLGLIAAKSNDIIVPWTLLVYCICAAQEGSDGRGR